LNHRVKIKDTKNYEKEKGKMREISKRIFQEFKGSPKNMKKKCKK